MILSVPLLVIFLHAKTGDDAVIDPVTCPFAMLTGSDCHRKRRQRLLANSQVAFINNTVIIYCGFLSKRGFAEFGKLRSRSFNGSKRVFYNSAENKKHDETSMNCFLLTVLMK